MSFQTHMGAKLGISGTLEFRDKDGNVLKTVLMNGSIPLSDVGLSVDEAKQLIEEHNGADHRE